MGASTVFIVLAAVLGVVYGLDLTKTESYYKNEAVVKSGNLLPIDVVDTSAVSKTTSLVNQEKIVSSVSSNPTTIVGDSSVYRALAKRCHCMKEKPGCCKGGLIKSIKENRGLCSKCSGMKTSETTCGGFKEGHGCHSCMTKGGEETTIIKENQGIACTSALEKEALLNKNKLSASSYNAETKNVAINKLGTANVVSDVAVQNNLKKSTNLENSVTYDSSYQSSGDNTVITDNINNVGYQGKPIMSGLEKEALLNKNKLSTSSYNKETKNVAINKLGTANVVSDVEVQNELTKSRNLKNSVTYDSSYQSSGDNTVVTDNINNVNLGYQSSGDASTINSINTVKKGSQISSSSSAIKSNAELELEKEQMLSSSASSSSSRSSSYKSGYADQYGNQVIEKREATEEYSSCK